MSYFSQTFSYCKATNTCLKDSWNFINAWCTSVWIPGWMIDIDADCEAPEKKYTCPSFVSDRSKYGVNTTVKTNLTLGAGSQCTMTIDATQAVARVMIDSGTNIGVLFNEYALKTWMTIPEGNIQEITLYNGRETGNESFIVIFTGATFVKLSAVVGAMGLLVGTML